jgi:secreted trypsin-like serine protease
MSLDSFHSVSVRLGEWDTSTDEDCDQDSDTEDCVDQPLQDIPISRTIVHEKYRLQDVNTLNDIGLVKLTRPAVFNFYVAPICLPHTDQLRNLNLEGQSLDVAGWGLTEFGYKSSIKQKVDVPVVSLQKCQKVFPTKQLTSAQICAGGVKGKDSCNGDSGGPLMKYHSDGQRQFVVLAGIVSYGNTACGKQGYPGVYTRVSSYLDWIATNLQR